MKLASWSSSALKESRFALALFCRPISELRMLSISARAARPSPTRPELSAVSRTPNSMWSFPVEYFERRGFHQLEILVHARTMLHAALTHRARVYEDLKLMEAAALEEIA